MFILSPPVHGLRTTYQATGCRCLPCRAAEAAYRAGLRRQHLKGIIPLGKQIPAQEAWKIVRALLVERFTKAEIARQLHRSRGVSPSKLSPVLVTERTLLKLRQLARTRLL